MAVTLCTVYEAQMKAGKNVSVSGGDANFMESFINEAEGYVCMRTRYNWIAAHAGLSAYVKYILRLAVSNLAAMYAIQYDMAGFTTRTEAETMLDVLRDGFVKAMEVLEDMAVKEFAGVK